MNISNLRIHLSKLEGEQQTKPKQKTKKNIKAEINEIVQTYRRERININESWFCARKMNQEKKQRNSKWPTSEIRDVTLGL